MAVREFVAASSHQITLAIGGLSGQTGGPITYAAILKRATQSAFATVVALNAIGSTQLMYSGFQATNLGYYVSNTTDDADGPAGLTYGTADGWVLFAVTKASGNVAPRFHKTVLSSATHSHNAGANTAVDGGAPSGSGNVKLGAKDTGFDFFNGRMAVAAVFPTVLSDGTIEGLSTALANWVAAAPTGLWPLDQAAVGDGVLDIVGSSHQSAIVGTTVVTGDDPPGFDWSLTPPDPGVVPLVVESPRLL